MNQHELNITYTTLILINIISLEYNNGIRYYKFDD